jgi:hypothetical protein
MNKNRIMRILCSILAILFGAFLFVYGEFDDSPGGQLLGLLVVIAGIVGVVKSRKKTPNSSCSGL